MSALLTLPFAMEISAAFIDNPEAAVISSCTADLFPRFVLPDEPLVPFS